MWITSVEIHKITENIILRESCTQAKWVSTKPASDETCSLHSTDGNYGHGFMAPRDKGSFCSFCTKDISRYINWVVSRSKKARTRFINAAKFLKNFEYWRKLLDCLDEARYPVLLLCWMLFVWGRVERKFDISVGGCWKINPTLRHWRWMVWWEPGVSDQLC